jgi:hypothetical protein
MIAHMNHVADEILFSKHLSMTAEAQSVSGKK